MKLTFATFTIGVAAIIGLPFLAGFFSKDAILYLAWARNPAVFAALAFTAVLTAFYMVRLWKIVFLGPARSDAAAHAHEGGATLWAPLVLLAALAVVGGYKGLYPNAFAGVIALIPEAEGPAHGVVLVTSLIVLLVGAGTAFALYGPVPAGAAAGGSADAPGVAEDALERASPGLFGLLVANQRSFDRVYDYYVAKVQQRFAMVLNFIDVVGLSGVVIRGGAGLAELLGFGARAAHTGRINTYVYWFLAGVAVLWAMAAGLF